MPVISDVLWRRSHRSEIASGCYLGSWLASGFASPATASQRGGYTLPLRMEKPGPLRTMRLRFWREDQAASLGRTGISPGRNSSMHF